MATKEYQEAEPVIKGLHNLSPADGSTKKSYRIGRGQGSGMGGTSTRGHKGQGSRAGYSYKIGFEGGQMPLQRRVPKYGFKNINRVEYAPVNLSTLERIATEKGITQFTPDTYREQGLAAKTDFIKILGRGELNATITVHAHAISASAREAIQAKGGSVILLNIFGGQTEKADQGA